MYQPESAQGGMVRDGEGNEDDSEEMVESGQEEPLPKVIQKKPVNLSMTPGSTVPHTASGSSSSVQSRAGTPRRKPVLPKK